MEYVFVYGTLRQGERNHSLLAGSHILARVAKTHGILVDTGKGYPAMLPDETSWVSGEVYQVDENTLEQLDQLEDYYGPNDERNEYERVLVQVTTESGAVEAWAYIYDSRQEQEQLQEILIIQSGDWTLYNKSQQ